MMRSGQDRFRVRYLVFVAILFLLLSAGCAPTPEDIANAHETTVLADQRAANLAQAREVKAANDAIELEIRNAKKAQVKLAWQRFIYWMGLVSVAVGGYALFYFGRTVVATVQGFGAAAVLATETKASLIPIDEETRMFPLFVRHIHGGRFLIHDANTGSTTVLDMDRPVDRQLAAMSGAVRLAGAVARESRRAENSDSTGVSLSANVPIIEAVERPGGIVVGQDISKVMEVINA